MGRKEHLNTKASPREGEETAENPLPTHTMCHTPHWASAGRVAFYYVSNTLTLVAKALYSNGGNYYHTYKNLKSVLYRTVQTKITNRAVESLTPNFPSENKRLRSPIGSKIQKNKITHVIHEKFGHVMRLVGEKNEMASAKKSQLFKFKELPPYPTHLVEEMANHIFISVYIVWKWLNSSTSLD